MNWAHDDRALPRSGFPIRRSPDQSLLSGSPGLFAASHVLRRLLAPRHPPCALSSLTMIATRYPRWMPRHNRLGELPRACSLFRRITRPDCQRPTTVGRTPIVRNEREPPGGRFFPRRTAIRACHARGGADGDRTHDLRLAKPALSQLSYSPADPRSTGCASRCLLAGKVGPGRVELPTLPLSGVRSSRLSYGPGRPGDISPSPPVSQN
jgi:hypothetical protein